jgi:hypothetical protein
MLAPCELDSSRKEDADKKRVRKINRDQEYVIIPFS